MLIPKQNRYDYSPIIARPDYSWPDGKRLAFWLGTGVEVFAFRAGVGHDTFHHGAPQTQRNYAWRDYGNRVGIWRLFELYQEFRLPASLAVNSMAYDYYPQIFERARTLGYPIIAHGRTNAERLHTMWEGDEERIIGDITATIARHEGRPPKGWVGSGVQESNVTLDLLQEAGYLYVLDWPCDDQPIWLRTRGGGKIMAISGPQEINDSGQILHRQSNAHDFADMLVDHFEEMVRQSKDQPLVCNLFLHPYIFGQPFRLPPLRRALKHITEHPQRDTVWFTTADAIAEHCAALPPGIVPGSEG